MATCQKVDYSSYGALKEEISEDMISEHFMDFMKEGKGLRHIYKVTLLESRYNNWLKKFARLNQQRKNLLMTKKKFDKKKIPVAIDTAESHIRWIKFVSSGRLAFVKNSAVVLFSGFYIFIYDVNESTWKIISVSKFEAVDGIGLLEGSKDENLFAFSEKCEGSRIFIVIYPELQVAYKLKDKFGGKVMALAFGGNETLIVLKCCMTEHLIVVWSWRTSKVIFNYPCENSYIHPEIIRISNFNPSCAVMEYNQNKQVLQFWNINFCGVETLFINRRTSELKVDKEIHDMFFSPEDILYLLDCDGNVYDYEYTNGSINLLIPWMPDYKPVPDVMEPHHQISDLLILSKGLPPECKNISNQHVEEEYYLPSEEPMFFKVPKLQYTCYNSDEYDESDDLDHGDKILLSKMSTKKCHMVWFNSGIVISGPDGRVKYYYKLTEDGSWVKIWGMIPADPFTQFCTNQKGDLLMGWSYKYGLVKITSKGASSEVLHYFGGSVHDMCFLHPLDSHFLTINDEPLLYIWKKKSGRLLSYVELACRMDAVLCHLESPLAILKSSNEGTLYGVEMKDPRAPLVWPALRITTKPISSISFMHREPILVAISQDLKEIFVVKVTIEEGFEIISKIVSEYEVINFIYLLTEDRISRGLALLKATPPDENPVPEGYTAGKFFHVIKYDCSAIERIWYSNSFYKSIITGPGMGQVLAIPADKKGEIHSFSISLKKAGGWKYLGAIEVYHQVGTFNMFIHEQHFLTYGFDGMITCYESEELFDNNVKPFCVIIPHHRFDGGIRQVIVDYKANYIISRGFNGLIVCSRLKLKNRCTHSFHTPHKHNYFYKLKPELKHVELNIGYQCWDDFNDAKQLVCERELAKSLRLRIAQELQEIKDIWHACYESNEQETPENQIPFIEFELNKSKLDYLRSACDSEISVSLQLHEEGLKINKAWNQRWKELCLELVPKKLLKLKPFVMRLVIENYNQSFKPLRYENHVRLMKMISDTDAAIFPDPVPMMLPWYPVNEDEDFYDSKPGQIVEEPVTTKEDGKEGAEVEEKPCEDVALEKEGENLGHDSCGVEKRGALDKVKAYQKEVLHDLKTSKRKENEKIIFQELEKIREFYNDKILKIKYREQGVEKTFEEWKKIYIGGKKGEDSDEDEEKVVNILEKHIFEDDITVKKNFDNEYEVDEQVEDKANIQEESGETVKEDVESNHENEEDEVEKPKGDDSNGNTGEEKDHTDDRGPPPEECKTKAEHLPKDQMDEEPAEVVHDSDEDSSFSWSEIDIGVKKPEEVLELPKKISSFRKMRARDDTQVLEFFDQRKKSEVIAVTSTDPLEEPFCMTGAQTSRLIDVDYARCNEFSLNGLFMADIHVAFLQMIIEKLENDFNKRFTTARERKHKEIIRIQKKKMLLLKHTDDLVNVCKGVPPEEVALNFSWTQAELMPDLIWTDHMMLGKTTKTTSCESSVSALKKSDGPSFAVIRDTLRCRSKIESESSHREDAGLKEAKDHEMLKETSLTKGPVAEDRNSEVNAGKKENSEEDKSAIDKAEETSSLKNKSINDNIEGEDNAQKPGELKYDGPGGQEVKEEMTAEESAADETYSHLADSDVGPYELGIKDYNEGFETENFTEGKEETEIYEEEIYFDTSTQEFYECFGKEEYEHEETQEGDFDEGMSVAEDEEDIIESENILEESIEEPPHEIEREKSYVLDSPETSLSPEKTEGGFAQKEKIIEKTVVQEKGEKRKLFERESLGEAEEKNMKMLQEYLEKMMGGAFQLTWQETLKTEIAIPSFLFEKTPDNFTWDDIKALEKYTFLKAIREKEIERHRKIAEEEIKKLTKEVKEIAIKFDLDLLELLKRKLLTEGSLQSELLKIARIKQKRLIAQRTLENINYMRDLLVEFQKEGKKLSYMSKVFLKKTAQLYNEIDKHQAAQKNIEADFFNKMELLKLTKKCLEILKSCLKKKPIFEGENKIYPTELLAIAKSLLKRKLLPYFSEASRSFFRLMEDLDSLRHSPPHLDQEVWNILVENRRLKIASDLKCKALQMLANEAEKTASLYYKYLVTHLQRYDKIKCHIRDQKIRLEHHCNKIEFQLLLPEGLVEAHQTGNIEDFKDCVYVSRTYIDNLNQEIVDLQKEKEEKWKDFDKYMEVVHSAELLHKELRLRIRIKDNLLRDVRTAKINKYTKEFLLEYDRKQKPVYDVKLLDHKKQEKIKLMVQRYFQTYYRSINNIKDIRDKRSQLIGDNLRLASENDKMAAENQELMTSLEESNTNKDDKKLREERNQLIILLGKLTRKYESNIKKIDELDIELQRLYMKNYPTFGGN